MNDEKQADLEAWRRWKQMPSPQNLELLMKQLSPIIQREVRRWSSLAPSYVLENEAKKEAIVACTSYNPAAGTALSTHVMNRLQKLSRVAYKNQSSVSVPEQQRLTFNRYNAAMRHLEDINGSKPTLDQVSDYLAIKPQKLRSIVETVGRRELLESGEGPGFVQTTPDDVLDLAYRDMTPIQRKIFEMRTGYNNTPIAKDAKQIIKATGLSQGQISYQLNAIKALLERAQQLR